MGIRDNLDQPDLAGAGQVRAAAGAAVAAGLHQPHVAVQRFFAAVLGVGQRFRVGYPAAHRGVGTHSGVGFSLGLGQLRGGERNARVHPHIGRADVEPDVLGPEQSVQRTA